MTSTHPRQHPTVESTIICAAADHEQARDEVFQFRQFKQRPNIGPKSETLVDELTPIGSSTVTHYACQKRLPEEEAAMRVQWFGAMYDGAGSVLEIVTESLDSIMAKRGLECPAHTAREANHFATEAALNAQADADAVTARDKWLDKKEERRQQNIDN